MSVKKDAQDYILSLFGKESKAEIYRLVAEEFYVPRKTVSSYWLDLVKKGEIDDQEAIPSVKYTQPEVKKLLKQEGENLFVSLNTDFEVKTLEDLLNVCEVDNKAWEVLSWQCKKWDLGIKNKEEKIETKALFSVSAKFKPRKLDNDLGLQKEVIIQELFGEAPNIVLVKSAKEYYKEQNPKADCLLELALFDVHFGKLAHREECGEDYDIKIASKRYKEAIADLLSRIDLNCIERILLPIGNDMINIDNNQGTTTAGTPQDSDSRFYKIVRTVKDLLIETINDLCKIVPVDVVVVSGNHDELTSFMIGEMLDAYYFNFGDRVRIINDAAFRKYYEYGTTSIMFTHGNKEKHANLGMIFAAENPELWAKTKQRYIQLGHYHSNKKINYLANEEFQGFQIQIVPSLSGSDAWHTGKGFNSLKQAKAFLYHKEKGLLGEFTHTAT